MLLAVAGLPLAVFAQVPSQVQRMEQFNQQQNDVMLQTGTESGGDQTAPELYSGESKDVGPQFIVRVKPERKWVEGTVDSQYYYTSNMLLTEQRPQDTTILVNTVQVALAPTAFDVAGGKLSPRLGFRYQWYNYGLDKTSNGYNNFDFDVETVFSDVRYQFGDNFYAGVGFEWNRLLNHEGPTSDYAEFYKEYVPNWVFGKYFPISDSMMVSVEYFGYYHFTNVDPIGLTPYYINDRLDEGLRVSYTQELIPDLYLQPFIRFQYSDYVNEPLGRNEYLWSAGCSFSYNITKWATARTFVTYDKKDSDNPIYADYSNINAGGGVTLTVSF